MNHDTSDDLNEEHPALEEELFAYADDTLDSVRRAGVAAHLLHCAICRQDVADALEERKAAARTRPRWPLAAAAALLIAILAARYMLDRKPVEAPAGYGRADWNTLVADVTRGAPVPVSPVLAELKPRRDLLRGNGENGPGSVTTGMQPSGTVEESDRPSFSWPATPSATYVVRIANGSEVIHSPPLDRPQWTPERPLPRGVTYTWQVEVRPTGTIIPSSPDVPPMFHILDAAAESELVEARRKFAHDDLLLGLLHARAGLIDDARRHLHSWTAAHPNDPRARALEGRIP